MDYNRRKDTNRSKRIGARVHEAAFQQLKIMADANRKTVSEWCSERLADLARGVPVPFEHALLAEIVATQAIMIDLIYTWAHDGKLSQKAVQDIVRAAQSSKFKDASQLFSAARSRLERGGLSATSETKPGETF